MRRYAWLLVLSAVGWIDRPESGSLEILFIPAGDGPAVFLSADGSEWRRGP